MSPAEMVNVAVFASFWNGPLAAAVISKAQSLGRWLRAPNLTHSSTACQYRKH